MKIKKETAYFAMGCFWTPQVLFDNAKGVVKTEVGYMGGEEKKKNYSYEEVCSGKTNHAETVKIEFAPKKVSYEELLEIFWKNHDPTQINEQGFDFGTQYRSAVFYINNKQKKLAEESKKKQQKKFSKPIATEIKKAGNFYPAEEYHQKYLEKRGMKTCHF